MSGRLAALGTMTNDIRLVRRLCLCVLLCGMVHDAGPSRPCLAGEESLERETFPADDPAVQLVLAIQEAGLGLCRWDDEGRVARSHSGRPITNYCCLQGPDEDGRYRFGEGLESVSGFFIQGGTDRGAVLTGAHVASIPEHFPNIEVLHITNNGGITSLWAPQLERFSALKELNVRLPMVRSRPDSDAPFPWTSDVRAQVSRTLCEGVSRATSLETLVLDCDLRDEDVAQLAGLVRLRELSLVYNDQGYEHITGHVRQLHDLPAEALNEAIGKMSELRSLSTTGLRFLGPVDWETLARLPHLETLQIPAAGLDDARLVGIERLQHLKTLDLSQSAITGKSLELLAKLPELETLNLEDTKVGSDILTLATLANLKEANFPRESFQHYPLDVAELEFFIRHCARGDSVYVQDPLAVPLTRINELVPGGITGLTLRVYENEPRIVVHYLKESPDIEEARRQFTILRRPTELDLERIEELTELEFIWVRTPDMQLLTDNQLARFASLKNLQTLNLELDRPISGATLSGLALAPALEHLLLSGVQLDEEAMSHIAAIPALNKLNIKGGSLEAGALRGLAQATGLKEILMHESLLIEGPEGEHLQGIDSLPALESLHISSRDGSDADCRRIGKCKALKTLLYKGTFSSQGLEWLTPMPNLESLSLEGEISITEEDLRILGRNPRLRWAAINNSEFRSGYTKNIYSETIAREFDIGFAGACDCGCMDVYAPEAILVGEDQFTIEDDLLVLDSEFRESLEQADREPRWSRTLRIRVPIEREHLRIDGDLLPSGLEGLYLNECKVKRLDLVNCLIEEIGVFGASNVEELHFMESAEKPEEPDEGSRYWANSPGFYLGNVGNLTFHTARSLRGVRIDADQKLQSLQFAGQFPDLESLLLMDCPKLKYLAAPYSGQAPKLRLSFRQSFFSQLSRLPSLRLLKMPGTATGDSERPLVATPETAARSWPPLHEVDLRRTEIGDTWLKCLAEAPTLRILRVAGCRNLTEEAKATFRKARPDVELIDVE